MPLHHLPDLVASIVYLCNCVFVYLCICVFVYPHLNLFHHPQDHHDHQCHLRQLVFVQELLEIVGVLRPTDCGQDLHDDG